MSGSSAMKITNYEDNTVIPTFTAESYSDPFGFRIESKLYKSKKFHGQVVVLMLTGSVDLKEKVKVYFMMH